MKKPTSLRDLLREGVAAAQMSVEELARRSGVNRATIYRALSDDPNHAPTSRTLDKLTRALDEVLGARSVKMTVSAEGLTFKAGWSENKSKLPPEQEAAVAIYALADTIILVIETAISAKMALSSSEKRKLFDDLTDPFLKIKLAKSNSALSEVAAENAATLVELARHAQASGDRLSGDDGEARAIAARFKFHDGRPVGERDPFAVAIAMGSMVLQGLANSGDYEKYLADASQNQD